MLESCVLSLRKIGRLEDLTPLVHIPCTFYDNSFENRALNPYILEQPQVPDKPRDT